MGRKRKKRNLKENPKSISNSVMFFLGNVITCDKSYARLQSIESFPDEFARCTGSLHRETILIGTRFGGPELSDDPYSPKRDTMVFFQKTYRECCHDGTSHLNADVYAYWTACNGSSYRACAGNSPDHYQKLLVGTGTTAIGNWLSSSAPYTGGLEEVGLSLSVNWYQYGPRCDF